MVRLATPDDAAGVHAIYAPIVSATAISFEYEVPDVTEMGRRLRTVLAHRPWLVYEEAGQVLGYVYAASFRDRAAYQWSTEVTIYLRPDARGRGLGRVLYEALFAVLRVQGYCTAVAGATLPNEASERLHARLGFRECGRFPAAGYKFGRWHDVVFWQLVLQRLPAQPAPIRPIHELITTGEFEDAIRKSTSRV